MLDVGTGSGAVALAIADELPDCRVTATDTSPAALEVARGNAEALGLADRVSFEAGSVPGTGEFDLIVANLPYVAESEWGSLQPEVTEWEPREALLAGPDGLDAIRASSDRGSERSSGLRTNCVRAWRWGQGQADAVEALLGAAGFTGIERRRDLAGIDRVVWGRRG